MPPITVAAVQRAPVYLDKERTIAKAVASIDEAKREGADLIVFPEAFVSGYPDWVWLVPNSDGKTLGPLHLAFDTAAATIEDLEPVREASKGAIVAIGVTEKRGSALYNSIVTFEDQKLLGVHRKLVPTGGERLAWARGDGSTLNAYETGIGTIGGLVCWESLMPLPRVAMYEAGVKILVVPTWDKSESWITSMRHIAREGGCFVVSCCMALKVSEVPYGFADRYPKDRVWVNPGNSCIVAPNGTIIAGPLEAEQAILYADLDFDDITRAKRLFDVSGHYARPDVFGFSVRR